VGGFVRVDKADRLFGFARVIASAFFFAARERVIGFFMVCVFSGSHTFTKSDRASGHLFDQQRCGTRTGAATFSDCATDLGAN